MSVEFRGLGSSGERGGTHNMGDILGLYWERRKYNGNYYIL